MEFKTHSQTHALQDLIKTLDAQNVTLAKARNKYLALEAERKHFEAKLILAAPGKSQSEKATIAQSSLDWVEFHLLLARAESVYEFQKLKFSILEKEFQSRYLELKLDQSLIKKQE